jgi:predicted ATPase
MSSPDCGCCAPASTKSTRPGTHVFRLLAFLMAEALGRAGQNAEGLAAIEEAIARSERTEERWAMAELVRVRGELLLLQGAPGAASAAEHHFPPNDHHRRGSFA